MGAGITVWGIHTMDDPLFLNQHLIAIGWEKMGNLSAIPASRDAYKEAYIAAYPDAKKGSIATSAGMRIDLSTKSRRATMWCFPPRLIAKSILALLRALIFMMQQRCIPTVGK